MFVVYVSANAWAADEPRDADRLIEAMDVNRGDWAADVGSRDGDYTLEIAETVGESGRAFAVDIDEDALEEFNEEVADEDIQNVTTVSSIDDTPMLPRKSFDAVLARNAYHEFEAHHSMLNHIRKALKSEGRFVLVEDIHDHLIDEERNEQEENHDLAMRYAQKELRKAGLEIVRAVDTLRYEDDHSRRYWMVIPRRAPNDRK